MIRYYFNDKNDILEAYLVIDENFINLRNKAIRYNEEEKKANTKPYTIYDIAPYCREVERQNQKVLREIAREKQKEQNKQSFWLLLNLLFGGK